ncbi:hypothetical protein HMN09_01253600 [Mycena chlorophos]|uniref:Uncharacterized protein n=1 Tax=Mycena chlorophos TaxID=658473 RepID=A0A8H6VXC0_MYCCL|nr:hypothetical protein HMN09_01253600 [Mycena chlorophos]
MIHTIALLASLEPAMALNISCAYMVTRGSRRHFVVYSLQQLEKYAGYNPRVYSFIAGDYSSDRITLPRPPRGVLVRPDPQQLKIRYLAYVRKTVALLRAKDVLLLPILAPCSPVNTNVPIRRGDAGTELAPEELAHALTGILAGVDVIVWMPSWVRPSLWTSPEQPWRVVFPCETRLSSKFPTKPLNIAVFIRPKEHPVSDDREQRHSGPPEHDVEDARELVRNLGTAIVDNNLDKSGKLQHPANLLLYSLYQIQIVPTQESPRIAWDCLLRPSRDHATLVSQLTMAGDALGHRLDCFMTVYVFSRYILGIPLEDLHSGASPNNPQGLYWRWLERTCLLGDSQGFDIFQDETKIYDLPYAVGIRHSLRVQWLEPLKWLAQNWIAVGKPPVTIRQVVYARLWRISAFAGQDALALYDLYGREPMFDANMRQLQLWERQERAYDLAYECFSDCVFMH